jgi:hypothetical protein
VHRRSDYRVELKACFTFTIEETVSGPAGLTQVELEEIIDQEWWWLSGSTDVLLESSWELEGFEESPAGDETT